VSLPWTPEEMMAIAAARLLPDGRTCFVGIGLPGTAANLARRLHAPDLVLIYESGPIGARPPVLPLSIGDGDLARTADTVVPTHEIFRYWLQNGRIDIGFLGTAQIDRFANLNTTVIGDYRSPRVRLPGAGGAPEIAAHAGETLVILRHRRRAFVARLDFVTTVGYLDGGDARERLGLRGRGPTRIVTDLCILEPEPESRELVVTSVHPGVAREDIEANTGWPVRFAPAVTTTPEPRPEELEALRELRARTEAAHGRPSGE